MKRVEKGPVGLGPPQPTVGQRNPSSLTPPPSNLPGLPTQSAAKWSKISEKMENFWLDANSITFHLQQGPACGFGIVVDVRGVCMPRLGVRSPARRFLLRWPCPLHRGSAWDVGNPRHLPRVAIILNSLQVLAFDRQNLKCTLISEDATFRWGLGRGSTGARTIVCGPADFIRLCVSFAAGHRRVRHCAHQNTASKTCGHVENIFEGHHSIKFGTGQTHTNTINLNKSLSSPDKLFQNSKQFTAKISMSDINCWLRQELFRSQYCQWATTNWATYFWVYANTTVSLSQQLL